MPKLSPAQLEAVAAEAQTALNTLRTQGNLTEQMIRSVQSQAGTAAAIIASEKDGPIQGTLLTRLKNAVNAIASLTAPPAPPIPTPAPASSAPAPEAAAPAAASTTAASPAAAAPAKTVPQPPAPAAPVPAAAKA
jgi:hypothetical protein